MPIAPGQFDLERCVYTNVRGYRLPSAENLLSCYNGNFTPNNPQPQLYTQAAYILLELRFANEAANRSMRQKIVDCLASYAPQVSHIRQYETDNIDHADEGATPRKTIHCLIMHFPRTTNMTALANSLTSLKNKKFSSRGDFFQGRTETSWDVMDKGL